MKARKILSVIGLASVLIVGCESHRAARTVYVTPAGTVVTEAPPAPRVETRGTAPNPDYAWVGGYWAYANSRWVWIPGHWERNRPGAVWVAGHWDRGLSGWAWTPGHWETSVGGTGY
jgi:hypothetical protein